MAHLGNILPPSSEQKRATERMTNMAEKPIKELLFAYFKLFAESRGPKYEKYRKIAELSGESFGKFVDKQSFYYIPLEHPGIEEEVCILVNDTMTVWEKWEFQPAIVPSDRVWDESGVIAALPDIERARVNRAVGEIIHITQLTWMVIAGRCPETKGLSLEICPKNITLKLVDAGKASKSNLLSVHVGVNITIKDKIEIIK